MKLRSLFILLLAAGALAAPAFADTTIAIVNIQQIMRDSTAAKSVKDQLDAKQKTFQAEFSKKQADLQKEYQDLSKQKAVLSSEAFDKKANAFQAKQNAAQKEVQAKRSELDNALSSALGDIQKSVFDIVSTIAKDKGYSIVMPSSQTLYFDTKLDITQDVLTQLNSKLPKVTVTFKDTAPSKSGDE